MAKLKPGYTVNEDGQVVSAATLVAASPFPPTPALVADVTIALAEEAQIGVCVETRTCNACGGAVHPDRERCLACQVRYGASRSISVGDALRQVEEELILQEMHPSDIEWFVEEALVVLNQSSFLTADQAIELVQPDYEAMLQERAEAQIRQQMLVPLEEQLTPGEQRAKKKVLEGEYLPPSPPHPLFGESVSQTIERELATEAATIEGELVTHSEKLMTRSDEGGGVITLSPMEVVMGPVPGRRTKEQKLVSVTTALLPADKERLQARAEAAGMKIGPFLRGVIENYLVSCG